MGELGKKRCWLFVSNFHSEGKAYVYQWSKAHWRSCFQKWYRLYILFAPENGSVSNFKGDSNHCVATELVNISDYFVKDLAKVVFPDFVPFNYCKIETNCDRPNLILNSIAYTQNCVYTGDCSQNLESIPKLNWIHNYPWMELWEKVVSWNHQNKCCILRSSEK